MIPVFQADLPDIRMQNIAVLAQIHRHRLIPGIAADHYQAAMADLLAGTMLKKNMAIFSKSMILRSNSSNKGLNPSGCS